MPKSWDPKVRDRAVLLWTKGYTRERIRDELLDLNFDVPVRSIRNWTDGIPRSGGEPWDPLTAPVHEVEVVAEMYRHAVSAGQAQPWPSRAQARWFARIRTLEPTWLVEQCYDVARYAAAVKGSEQRKIAAALMLWAGEAETDSQALEHARADASIAGFTWATASPAGATASAHGATVKVG